MTIKIKEVETPDEKSGICNDILRSLPDWFGIEESLADYVNKSRHMPLYAAFDGDRPVGFVAVKAHNAYTSEVCVMGVKQDYHHQGIGRMLIGCCERYCAEHGMEFLTVKTLDESRESVGYARTRAFYLAMGFRPLEVFPLLWDEANPCLFMVKCIRGG